MQSLVVAEACGPVSVASVEVERYRARPVEVDDTGVLRVRLAAGPPIVVAVTLCADEPVDPMVIVHAEHGRAVLGYIADTLRLPGEPADREVPGRVGLLENLLAHRSEPDVRLLAPVQRTAPFTVLVDAVAADDGPAPIDARYLAEHGTGPDRVVTVRGVTRVVADAADRLMLPSELAAPWAPTSSSA